LSVNSSFTFPTLQVLTSDYTIPASGSINVTYKLNVDSNFNFDGNIYYIFYTHNGWDYGQKYTETIEPNINNYEFEKTFSVSNNTNVLTVAAGYNITLGNFEKRIWDQKILLKDGINYIETTKKNKITIWPNPANEVLYLDLNNGENICGYNIYDIWGRELIKAESNNKSINISSFPPGVYILVINNHRTSNYTKFIKK